MNADLVSAARVRATLDDTGISCAVVAESLKGRVGRFSVSRYIVQAQLMVESGQWLVALYDTTAIDSNQLIAFCDHNAMREIVISSHA